MSKVIDLTGQRFGRLVALNYLGNRKWNCICDCGNKCVKLGSNLKHGTTRSCGCLSKELSSKRNRTHGMKKTRLYHIWRGMKARCLNPNEPDYKHYGGRGITVCEEWKNSFETFRDWAFTSGYRDNLTIDRIDVNGGYFPNNCRWADIFTQNRNKRTTRYVTYKNETKCYGEWSEIVGIPVKVLWGRINNKGWSVERAFNTPYQPREGEVKRVDNV